MNERFFCEKIKPHTFISEHLIVWGRYYLNVTSRFKKEKFFHYHSVTENAR